MTATGFQKDAAGDWIEKDPNAVLDYGLDWGVPLKSWLAGETIASVAWTVPPGLTQVSASNSDTVAKVRLSGGTVGVTYTITCRITTSTGQVEDRSFRVVIRER